MKFVWIFLLLLASPAWAEQTYGGPEVTIRNMVKIDDIDMLAIYSDALFTKQFLEERAKAIAIDGPGYSGDSLSGSMAMKSVRLIKDAIVRETKFSAQIKITLSVAFTQEGPKTPEQRDVMFWLVLENGWKVNDFAILNANGRIVTERQAFKDTIAHGND